MVSGRVRLWRRGGRLSDNRKRLPWITRRSWRTIWVLPWPPDRAGAAKMAARTSAAVPAGAGRRNLRCRFTLQLTHGYASYIRGSVSNVPRAPPQPFATVKPADMRRATATPLALLLGLLPLLAIAAAQDMTLPPQCDPAATLTPASIAFLGPALFKQIGGRCRRSLGAHLPPPPALSSPPTFLWGTRSHQL